MSFKIHKNNYTVFQLVVLNVCNFSVISLSFIDELTIFVTVNQLNINKMDELLLIDVRAQLKMNLITMESAQDSFERLKMPASASMMDSEINRTKELIKKIEYDNTKRRDN